MTGAAHFWVKDGMKITRYSKDVDILMVKVSDEPIAYAEEAERFIIHFSNDGTPVLLEIMDAKDFALAVYDAAFSEDEDEDEATSAL